jgi:hypothetical protein
MFDQALYRLHEEAPPPSPKSLEQVDTWCGERLRMSGFSCKMQKGHFAGSSLVLLYRLIASLTRPSRQGIPSGNPDFDPQ